MISIDDRQVAAFAAYLKKSANLQPFDFCARSEGFIYPERNRPGAL